MNNLFAGELTESDFIRYVKAMESRLVENAQLAEQAANNTEEQFMLGDFKEIFSNTVIDSMEAPTPW